MKKNLFPLVIVFLFSSTLLLAMEERNSETSEHKSNENISGKKRLRENTEKTETSAAQISYRGTSAGSISCNASEGDEFTHISAPHESHTFENPSQPVQKRQCREEQNPSSEEKVAPYDGTEIPSLHDLAIRAATKLPANDRSFISAGKRLGVKSYFDMLKSNIENITRSITPEKLEQSPYYKVKQLLKKLKINRNHLVQILSEKNYQKAFFITYQFRGSLFRDRLSLLKLITQRTIDAAFTVEYSQRTADPFKKRFLERKALCLTDHADALSSLVHLQADLQSHIAHAPFSSSVIKQKKTNIIVADKIVALSVQQNNDLNLVLEHYKPKKPERPFLPAFALNDTGTSLIRTASNRNLFGFFESASIIRNIAIQCLRQPNLKSAALWYEKCANALQAMAKLSSDSSSELAPIRDSLIDKIEKMALLSFENAQDCLQTASLLQQKDELPLDELPEAESYYTPIIIPLVNTAIYLRKHAIDALALNKESLSADLKDLASQFKLLAKKETDYMLLNKMFSSYLEAADPILREYAAEKNRLLTQAHLLESALKDQGTIDDSTTTNLTWDLYKTFEENMTVLRNQAALSSSRVR